MNIVVIALNGCPVSALGPYGNEWIAAPNLDRLAAEGVVFDRHISDCPDPAAARRAWRTGVGQVPLLQSPPVATGGLSPDILASLTSAGVRTVLLNHTRLVNDLPTAFLAGWSEVVTARPDPADGSPATALLRALPPLLERLAAGPPFLLWVELDRLLPPWDVPQEVFDAYVEDLVDDVEPEPTEESAKTDASKEVVEVEIDAEDGDEEDEDEEEPEEPEVLPEPIRPWSDPPTGWFDRDDLTSWELLHRSFAAAITALDADLGRIFDLLRNRGLDTSAAWLLTADRGFPLGERGMIGPHRPWLHEELVQLPLIVRFPDAANAGRRVAALTQPADLAPTLAALFGASGPGGDGSDLLPLMRGEITAVREFAVTGMTTPDAAEWAVRTPDWAFILPVRQHPDDDPRPPMLFEKPDDVWEVNDLRRRHLDLADDLEAKLRAATVPGRGRSGEE
ncbi:MAG: sulfatase family protein [Fimbriiglobus sp.]